jgi:hypothetical protein
MTISLLCFIYNSIRRLSGKYLSVLNILRTGCMALMQLGSPSEEILLCIHEQSLSLEASHLTVRRRWLSLCTVWPLRSQITSISTAILALGKARRRREPNLGCRGADRPGWCDALPKSLHDSCRLGRHIVVMKLICSLGNCICDGHTVHKLSQLRLTADWRAPRDSDCSRMHSKVSSDWLPSYNKATRPVLKMFKITGYFLDRPRRDFMLPDNCCKSFPVDLLNIQNPAHWPQLTLTLFIGEVVSSLPVACSHYANSMALKCVVVWYICWIQFLQELSYRFRYNFSDTPFWNGMTIYKYEKFSHDRFHCRQ